MKQGKKEIRTFMKLKRNDQDESSRKAMNAQIISNLVPLLKGNVASFIAFRNEVSLQALEEVKGISVAYSGIEDDYLIFYKMDNDIVFETHPFGMQIATRGNVVKEFDVVLVPLLAYDKRGYRIGYGGGYYDRFLATTTALKIGVAYSFQEMQNIPYEDWDIPLDIIVNENEVIVVNSNF